jgi:hypothetical protein
MPLTKRPSRINSAMFSGLAFGTFFLVTGLIGYNADTSTSMLAGSRWTGKPIPWQIAFGSVLLAVGLILFRRLIVTPRAAGIGGGPRGIKSVGKGRSRGAQQADSQRALPGQKQQRS